LTRGRILYAAAAVVVLAGLGWWFLYAPEERAIRARLAALRDDVNAGVVSGLDNVIRAGAIGSFFTEDVVVDLGAGTAAIDGRATVMGMAARLQPRTASFRVQLDDIGIDLRGDRTSADVRLTATFIRRSTTTDEESIDAREFALVMTKADGEWRISRMTAVDTLK
jgi:hypothetical protein